LVEISWQGKDLMMRFASVCSIAFFFLYQDANGKLIKFFFDLQPKHYFYFGDKSFFFK